MLTYFQFNVLIWLAVAFPVWASITVMESGKSFPSRPDKNLGHQLWKGSDYMGRLQFVHGNLQLCTSAHDPTKTFSITGPTDGLPVAIYAKSGGCSLKEKALVASTLLDPPNVVGYLIVDDDRQGRRNKRKKASFPYTLWSGGEEALALDDTNNGDEDDGMIDDFIENWIWGEKEIETDEDRGLILDELVAQVQKPPHKAFDAKTIAPLEVDADDRSKEDDFLKFGYEEKDETNPPAVLKVDWGFGEDTVEDDSGEDMSGDDQNFPLMVERFRVTSEENVWLPGGDEVQSDDFSGRRLKDDNNSINVAILHTQKKEGNEILNILLKDTSENERMGGPKVILNSKGGSTSKRSIFVWTMFSLIASVTCCCMLLFVEYREEETTTPQQAVRRRLTNTQVRDSFPAFRYHPENHVEQPLDDECAICLDDFEEGMRLRKLPCGHIFHSTCVARWLIERHANCPLCKMDLFEEEEDDEEEEQEILRNRENLRERYGFMRSVTRLFPTDRPVPTETENSQAESSSRSMWSLWRPQMLTVSDHPNTTEATDLPIPPPRRAFWRSARGDLTDDETAGALWRSPTQWWQTRRRDNNSRVLAEFAEPLMGGTADEENISHVVSDAAEEIPVSESSRETGQQDLIEASSSRD